MGFLRIVLNGLFAAWFLVSGWGPGGLSLSALTPENQVLRLENRLLVTTIRIENGMLASDCLGFKNHPDFTKIKPGGLETDGDFRLEIVWTGWRPPGNPNNADNAITLSKRDFVLQDVRQSVNPAGIRKLALHFKGRFHPFEIRILYELGRDDFYVRRKLAVRGLDSKKHFLHWIWPRFGRIPGRFETVKNGGFGQPLAFVSGQLGIFFGLEYPSAENRLISGGHDQVNIGCGQVMGQQITGEWLAGEPVVEAITPAGYLKAWFMKYINDIRVAPLKPYILYNTWYDLRAPEMVSHPGNIMNEKNINRIIDEFDKNMTDPFGLTLDAFVLDDGWDVYRSDWRLRKNEFPRGLKPISKRLARSGARLGIWLGPTGGYSHREWRIDWMAGKGYEVAGDQLCLAGIHYRQLLKKRVVDFVSREQVGYFKWDGIQFLCNEPGHGHPQGLYSRRAVMESLQDLETTVREMDPDIFLNITSGTWLSPWWVKYANTIWMQGDDYGYTDVPSISRRDRAMTYRDYVLYDGLRNHGFWFPVANLMTHGIIKGHLQKLGGESEPLDKFTDNALLYVARGVSMWELYVSPDLLSRDEWKAIAESVKWARDRFPLLMSTEMIGGNPGKREPYGYIHGTGKKLIIAARNPGIHDSALVVDLSPSLGVNSSATDLVLEKTYPYHWVSPRLTGYGERIELPLIGFETAIYELYPLEDADLPLLADAVFEPDGFEGNRYHIQVLETGPELKILNPQRVLDLTGDDQPVDPVRLNFRKEISSPLLDSEGIQLEASADGYALKVNLLVNGCLESGRLALLFENRGEGGRSGTPRIQLTHNGRDTVPGIEQEKEKWTWALIPVSPGKHDFDILLSSGSDSAKLSGTLSLWLVAKKRYPATSLSFHIPDGGRMPSQPPRSWTSTIMKRVIKLKEFDLSPTG